VTEPQYRQTERRLVIDRTTASAARMFDHLLGGSENLAVDRRGAEYGATGFAGGLDEARVHVRSNRKFLGRAVRGRVFEAGIRQSPDVGTGIPTGHNVHQVARATTSNPMAVYVGNNPSEPAEALAPLDDMPAGTTTFLKGDVRHPVRLQREAVGVLDLGESIGLMLVAIWHLVRDEDRPNDLLEHLVDEASSPDSHVVISHHVRDIRDEEVGTGTRRSTRRWRRPSSGNG
jgi:hypothetical protein